MKSAMIRVTVSLLVAVGLAACQFLAPEPTPPPPEAVAPPTVAPTASLLPTAVPPAPTPTRFDYAGWQTYANGDYGFSFRYPGDWALLDAVRPPSTMVGHLVQVAPGGGSFAVLSIAFKRVDEDQQIIRTGVGSGDLITMGAVGFLGEAVDRVVLVLDGRHHGVLYDGAREMERGARAFTICLDLQFSHGQALTPEEEEAVDLLVASFTLTD